MGGWGWVDWINVAQGRDKLRSLVNTAANLWAAGNSGKLLPSQ
jgi:hypothetical protein